MLTEGERQGNYAERYNLGDSGAQPLPALRGSLEFISTSITRLRPAPPAPAPFPTRTRSPPSFSLPVILPAPLLSLRGSFLVSFSPEPVWFSAFGCCALLQRLGSAPSLPLPRPFRVPPITAARAWRSTLPLVSLECPSRPAHPVPLQALHSHKVWLPSCGGRGRPRPAQLCPQRPDPGFGPQTSPYLIPAPV